MKGQNEITVNQATLIEMAQEYFDKRTVSSLGVVISVKVAKPGYLDLAGATILIRGEEPEEKQA